MNGWRRLVKMSLRLIVMMVAVLHVTASILSKKSAPNDAPQVVDKLQRSQERITEISSSVVSTWN